MIRREQARTRRSRARKGSWQREQELDLESMVEKFNQMLSRIYSFLQGRNGDEVDDFMDEALEQVAARYERSSTASTSSSTGAPTTTRCSRTWPICRPTSGRTLMMAGLNELVAAIQLGVRERQGAQEIAVVLGHNQGRATAGSASARRTAEQGRERDDLAQDDYYYEIQLTNKQLVFYFMAGATGLILSFLAGVMVGRGVDTAQGEVQAARTSPRRRSIAEEPAVTAAPSPDRLTYAQRLESDKAGRGPRAAPGGGHGAGLRPRARSRPPRRRPVRAATGPTSDSPGA